MSLLGGSMGGGGRLTGSRPKPEAGQLYKLILLAPARVSSPERLQGDKLFIVSEGDGLHSSVLRAHEKASDPKRLVVLEGGSHAQAYF